ncbi:MAG: hypothetical protein AB7S54_05920 [Bacteroidales bacterium]
MEGKLAYKQIVITELSDEISVFHLSESKFKEAELFIMGLAQFVEYAEYYRPKYVVIDKRNLEYKMPIVLNDYFNKYGFECLRKAGVKKVLHLVNANDIDSNDAVRKPAEILEFPDLESCLKYIKEDTYSDE